MVRSKHVFLNLNSAAGSSKSRFDGIESRLVEKLGKYELHQTKNKEDFFKIHKEVMKLGRPVLLVSAGGDGGFNQLLNATMENLGEQKDVVFGAIGLGSSNDLHKPFKSFLGKFPVLLNVNNFNLWDVACLEGELHNGQKWIRYFVINASIGLTAEGNDFFNKDTFLMKKLKVISHPLANFYTIVNVLARFKSKLYRLELEDHCYGIKIDQDFQVANCGFLKKTNVTGTMNYNTKVQPHDSLLDVVMAHDMNRSELISLIVSLEKGVFLKVPKTHYWRANHIKISSFDPFPVEYDGEVISNVRWFKCSTGINTIKICSP